MYNYYTNILDIDKTRIKKIKHLDGKQISKLRKSYKKIYKRDCIIVNKHISNNGNKNYASHLINNGNDGSNIVDIEMTIHEYSKIVCKYAIEKKNNNTIIYNKIVENYYNIYGYIFSILALTLIISFQVDTKNINYSATSKFYEILQGYQYDYYNELKELYKNYKNNKRITGDKITIDFKCYIKQQSDIIDLINIQVKELQKIKSLNSINNNKYILDIIENIHSRNKQLFCMQKKYNKNVFFLL